MKRRYIFRREPTLRKKIIPRKLIQISAGNLHSLGLDNNGQVWGWGWQQCNEMGNNTGQGSYIIPTSGVSNVFHTKIYALNAATYTIDEYRQLWSFGWWDFVITCNNTEFQVSSTSAFEAVDGEGWVFATTPSNFTCIDDSGQLWIINPPTYSYITSQWTYYAPTALFTGYTWSHYSQEPTQLGYGFAVAVDRTTGYLWAWGNGDYGCLGQNDSGLWTSSSVPIQVYSGDTGTDQFKFVVCGDHHAHAITTAGVGWSWGMNGDLGDANHRGMLGVTYDADEKDKPVLISGSHTWEKIDAGYYFSVGLDTAGKAWSWGTNDAGQLGLGYTGNTTSPSITYYDTPQEVIGGKTFVDISCGANWVLALDANGVAWSWGSNGGSTAYGMLGIGDNWTTTKWKTSPTQVLFPTT